MQPHDSAYKTLFSDPDIVRSLLLDVIQDDWVHQHRTDPHQEPPWLYVYLLLEFQSSIDPYMAVRMMSYTALLYERLIRQKINGKKFKGKLPAVLPIVVYNGETRWSSPSNVAALIEPTAKALQPYQPSMAHFVLDLLHLPSAHAMAPNSYIGAIINFEQAPNPEHIDALVTQLCQHLIGPQHEHLRQTFAIWVHHYIMERFAQNNKMLELDHPKDLTELQTMTRTQAQIWKNTILQEGILAGQIQGKAEGEAKGKAEGKAEALKLLLASKFGALPTTYDARIAGASLVQVQTWFISALSATSLEAVFDRH
jgi:Putative transposase, YhgA-like